jgi:hypothetical protein
MKITNNELIWIKNREFLNRLFIENFNYNYLYPLFIMRLRIVGKHSETIGRDGLIMRV